MAMPTKHHKSFSEYFSKMKKKPLISFPSKNMSSSGSWILRGCRHPRTPSFGIPDNGGEVTLADVDRFLLENFKSVFLNENHCEENISPRFGSSSSIFEAVSTSTDVASTSNVTTTSRSSITDNSATHTPVLLPTPSTSGLLFEVARTSADVASSSSSGATKLEDLLRSTNDDDDDDDDDYDGDQSDIATKENPMGTEEDFISVLKYSSTPYDEFKRSIQEMMEARLNHHEQIDWEFMEELMLCYLNLNDKKSYKFLLSAFVDLIAVYGVSSGRAPSRSQDDGSSAERRGKEKGTKT